MTQTPESYGAEAIRARVDAVELADRTGDAEQAGAFEAALAKFRGWAPWTPAGIVAALVEEAMRFDSDCASVGLEEALAPRAAARRAWEGRTSLGFPPVPPMVPGPPIYWLRPQDIAPLSGPYALGEAQRRMGDGAGMWPGQRLYTGLAAATARPVEENDDA